MYRTDLPTIPINYEFEKNIQILTIMYVSARFSSDMKELSSIEIYIYTSHILDFVFLGPVVDGNRETLCNIKDSAHA